MVSLKNIHVSNILGKYIGTYTYTYTHVTIINEKRRHEFERT